MKALLRIGTKFFLLASFVLIDITYGSEKSKTLNFVEYHYKHTFGLHLSFCKGKIVFFVKYFPNEWQVTHCKICDFRS